MLLALGALAIGALSLGEYDRHDFEVCWDWRRQAWAWNT